MVVTVPVLLEVVSVQRKRFACSSERAMRFLLLTFDLRMLHLLIHDQTGGRVVMTNRGNRNTGNVNHRSRIAAEEQEFATNAITANALQELASALQDCVTNYLISRAKVGKDVSGLLTRLRNGLSMASSFAKKLGPKQLKPDMLKPLRVLMNCCRVLLHSQE